MNVPLIATYNSPWRMCIRKRRYWWLSLELAEIDQSLLKYFSVVITLQCSNLWLCSAPSLGHKSIWKTASPFPAWYINIYLTNRYVRLPVRLVCAHTHSPCTVCSLSWVLSLLLQSLPHAPLSALSWESEPLSSSRTFCYWEPSWEPSWQDLALGRGYAGILQVILRISHFA